MNKLLIFSMAYNMEDQNLVFNGNMTIDQIMFLMQLVYKDYLKQEIEEENKKAENEELRT